MLENLSLYYFTNLKKLLLQSCKISDELLEYLSSFTSNTLTIFELNNCNLSNTYIKIIANMHLPYLEYLSLINNPINEIAVLNLKIKKLPRPRKINLSQTGISIQYDMYKNYLKAAFPEISIINVFLSDLWNVEN
jgi:hypothetical protein